MTTALEGGEWSVARPGRYLPPGKTRYPFYRMLNGPQGRSGRAENFAPPVFLTALYLVVIRVQEAHRQLLFMALEVDSCLWCSERSGGVAVKTLW